MLNCDLCDYFKTLNVYKDGSVRVVARCEHTGFIFNEDPQDLDIEYPCNSMEYEQKLPETDAETA